MDEIDTKKENILGSQSGDQRGWFGKTSLDQKISCSQRLISISEFLPNSFFFYSVSTRAENV
jgi:hypothetical protein